MLSCVDNGQKYMPLNGIYSKYIDIFLDAYNIMDNFVWTLISTLVGTIVGWALSSISEIKRTGRDKMTSAAKECWLPLLQNVEHLEKELGNDKTALLQGGNGVEFISCKTHGDVNRNLQNIFDFNAPEKRLFLNKRIKKRLKCFIKDITEFNKCLDDTVKTVRTQIEETIKECYRSLAAEDIGCVFVTFKDDFNETLRFWIINNTQMDIACVAGSIEEIGAVFYDESDGEAMGGRIVRPSDLSVIYGLSVMGKEGTIDIGKLPTGKREEDLRFMQQMDGAGLSVRLRKIMDDARISNRTCNDWGQQLIIDLRKLGEILDFYIRKYIGI